MSNLYEKIDQEQNIDIPLIYIVNPVYIFSTLPKKGLAEISGVDQTESEKDTDETQSNETNDIEFISRQTLNRGNVPKREADITKLANKSVASDNNTENNNRDIMVTLLENNLKNNSLVEVNFQVENNTDKLSLDSGSLKLNSAMVLSEVINLPLVNDSRWKKFTVNDNLNETNLENDSSPNETSVSMWPYSAALYNNELIDQLSITTNSYTNSEPLPPRSDRWASFDSLKGGAKSNEFKPLAGLYYDGFLHTPVIRIPSFIPYNNYYNYTN